jgi:hypothetical protein
MRFINLQCAGDNMNTGIQSCSWNPSNITGAIHVPHGKAYSATDVSVLWTTLQADLIEDSKTKRIYPVGPFKAITDNSTDVQIETDGYGGQTFVRDGDYNWTFEYKNGMCFYKALRTFHTKNSSFDVFFIDEVNNVLWGTENADGDLVGFSLELLIVPNIKINTGDASTKYMITYGLQDPTELNDNSYAVSFPNNQKLMKLSGLLDTTLVATSTINATTGDVDVTLNSSCNATDLAELFPTELADISPAPAFTVYNVTQAAAVAITGIVVNGSTITITTDATDHAAADICTIQFGPISAMQAVGILGYAQSNLVNVTVA